MANSDEDLDELAQRAAEEILRERNAGERVSVAATAREDGVDRFRISRRLKRIGGRTSRKPVNSKLSAIQETSLLQYIHTMDEIGLAIQLDQVSNMANAILKQDYTGEDSPPIVGLHWPQRLLDRHPELRKVKQKPLELERKLTHDPDMILDWFQRFQALQEQFGVQNEDIWNFNETGFHIGVKKSQWIINSSTSKRSYLASDNSRDLVTSVEAVNAGGIVIEEMLILPGKVHLERFYHDLKEEVLVGVSESGYSNDELALAHQS